MRSTCLVRVALDRGQKAALGRVLVVAFGTKSEYPVASDAGSLGAIYRRSARLSKCCSPSMRLKPPTSRGRAYGVLEAGRYAAMSKRGCIAATAAARDSALRAAVFAWLVAARDQKKCVVCYEYVSARLFTQICGDLGCMGSAKAKWAGSLVCYVTLAARGCRLDFFCVRALIKRLNARQSSTAAASAL